MISPGPKTELERLRFRVLALERLRDVATDALVAADYYLSEVEYAYGDEGVPLVLRRHHDQWHEEIATARREGFRV